MLSPHESTKIFGQKWWRRSNYSFISLIYGKLCENATYWAMSVQDIIAGGNGQTQWSNQRTQRKVGFIHCCTFIQKRTLWHGCQNGEYYLAAQDSTQCFATAFCFAYKICRGCEGGKMIVKACRHFTERTGFIEWYKPLKVPKNSTVLKWQNLSVTQMLFWHV